MPTNINNAARTKEMILSVVKSKGPSLPINIARDVKTSTLFASAFLSELYQERKLLMSHLKVGSTSLYLMHGQEQMLENFIQFLNHKEQEAFHMLKNSGKLDESLLPPAIRVAIKGIKDFAIPIQEIINGETKVFWKYAFLKDQSSQNQIPIQQKEVPITIAIPSNPNIAASIQQAVESQLTQQNQQIQKPQEQQINSLPNPENNLIKEIKENINQIESEISTKKERKKSISKPKDQANFSFSITEAPKEEIKEETQFGKEVRKYCKNKEIEILNIEEESKKEFTATIEINTPLGKHNFYCLAKDRKKLNEQDIQQALQKAQEKRMPILLLISAPIDKKGQSMIQGWNNLIKVDKL